jgi:RNA polymerase-binding transcription factor DksA
MHYHYFTIEQRESLERRIRSVAAAGEATETLRRLHSPDYGVCRACGADIPYVRLMEAPAALYCKPCESLQ